MFEQHTYYPVTIHYYHRKTSNARSSLAVSTAGFPEFPSHLMSSIFIKEYSKFSAIIVPGSQLREFTVFINVFLLWIVYFKCILLLFIWLIGQIGRVFAYCPGDQVSIPGWVIPKTLKMVFDTSLLNTQHYEVRIKGKVEQSMEWSGTFSYTSV